MSFPPKSNTYKKNLNGSVWLFELASAWAIVVTSQSSMLFDVVILQEVALSTSTGSAQAWSKYSAQTR